MCGRRWTGIVGIGAGGGGGGVCCVECLGVKCGLGLSVMLEARRGGSGVCFAVAAVVMFWLEV